MNCIYSSIIYKYKYVKNVKNNEMLDIFILTKIFIHF